MGDLYYADLLDRKDLKFDLEHLNFDHIDLQLRAMRIRADHINYYSNMIKNIEYEKLINVNLDKKYIIQNQTTDQREFVIRFLNLIKSLNNNICLYFNNNNIPYLRSSNTSINWTKNKIRCSLYRKNIDILHYRHTTWNKQTKDNIEYMIGLNFSYNLYDKLDVLFHADTTKILRKNRIVRVYSAEYIKKLFSYFYSKDELHSITQKLNILKDISGIIHSYCFLD
jgi:hypothetical protein